jgi:uncharacterized protein
MYLVDTNVWLERLLGQDSSEEVAAFLEGVAPQLLFMTDFAFHSIGVVCSRLKSNNVFEQFVNDVVISAGVSIVGLKAEDMGQVISAASTFGLDFDDAYQYAAADKLGLTLVTFDNDFRRTPLDHKTPSQATPVV